MNIKNAKLPAHTVDVLLKTGITTTEELNELTEDDLIKVRNLGKRDFDAIKEMRAMNEAIDVEYREIGSLEEKTTEELATEANELWRQMELIGNIGIQLAIQAGERLNVAKEQLKHGEWEEWAQTHLDFSLRKAKNMMRLATKASDGDSLFSNRQTFADIGISKVYALLSTSEEVAEEVIKEPDAADISVKKFQERIKELESEKKALEEGVTDWKEKAKEADNRIDELEDSIKQLSNVVVDYEKRILEQKEAAEPEDIRRYEEELTKAKRDLSDKQREIKALNESKDKEIAEAIEKAKAEVSELAELQAEEKNQGKLAEFEETIKEKEKQIAKLTKSIEQNDNSAITEFKIKSKILQENFNDCLKNIEEVESDQAIKMKAALKKVMQVLIERI